MAIRAQLAMIGALLVGVGATGWLAGRSTAPTRDRGFVAGTTAGYAEGLAAGRALQVGDSVPPGSKAATVTAFKAGYRAGQTDSFGAYDGGWKTGFPYVVVLADGVGGAAYQIASRIQFEPERRTGCVPTGTQSAGEGR